MAIIFDSAPEFTVGRRATASSRRQYRAKTAYDLAYGALQNLPAADRARVATSIATTIRSEMDERPNITANDIVARVNELVTPEGGTAYPGVTIRGRQSYVYVQGGQQSVANSRIRNFNSNFDFSREIAELAFYEGIRRHNANFQNGDEGMVFMSEATRMHDEWIAAWMDDPRPSAVYETMQTVFSEHLGMDFPSRDEMNGFRDLFSRISDYEWGGAGSGRRSISGLLPVSPYDNRWRELASVQAIGARLGFIDIANLGAEDVSYSELAFPQGSSVLSNAELISFGNQADDFLEVVADEGVYAFIDDRSGDFARTVRHVDVVDPVDISGVARLRAYMSRREYQDMLEYVREGWGALAEPGFDFRTLGAVAGASRRNEDGSPILDDDGNPIVAHLPGDASSDAARDIFLNNVDAVIDRAQAICSRLIDEGYEYRVQRGSKPGQIEIVVSPSDVTVRLMDSPTDIAYVGRTMDKATQTQSYVRVDVEPGDMLRYFDRVVRAEMGPRPGGKEAAAAYDAERSSRANRNFNLMASTQSVMANFSVDADLFADNVMYVLGAPVQRQDGTLVGEGDSFVRGNSTDFGDKVETMRLGHEQFEMRVAGAQIVDGRRVLDGQVLPESFGANVRVHTISDSRVPDTSVDYTLEPTSHGARLALFALVEDARNNLYSQVDVERLVESAEATARRAVENGDDSPLFDEVPEDVSFGGENLSSPDVIGLRESYWRFAVDVAYEKMMAESVEGYVPRVHKGLAPVRDINDGFGGTLRPTHALEGVDGAVDLSYYVEDRDLSVDATLAALEHAIEGHLGELVDKHIGYVRDANGHTVNYVSLSPGYFDEMARVYQRISDDGLHIGADAAQGVRSSDGAVYFTPGVEELESVEFAEESGLSEVEFEALTHDIVMGDVAVVDLSHAIEYGISGTERARRTTIGAIVRGLASHNDLDGATERLRPNERATTGVLESAVVFDADSSVTLSELRSRQEAGDIEADSADAYRLRMLNAVEESIRSTRSTANPDDIAIDANGIVSWSATRMRIVKYKKRGEPDIDDTQVVHGIIGQVFVPDEDGLLQIGMYGAEPYRLAGGHELHALDQMTHQGDFFDRLRATGIEDKVERQLRRQVRNSIIGAREKAREGQLKTVGYATSLNRVYRDDNVSTRFRDDPVRDGLLDEETRSARIAQAKSKCRYVGFDAMEETSIVSSERQLRLSPEDFCDDRTHDGAGITQRGETTHLTEKESSLFDFAATPKDKKVAIIRYLNVDAGINEDGSLRPGQTMGHSPITSHSVMQFSREDAHNRQQMCATDAMHALTIDEEPSGVAMIALGGWNQDDGLIVSSSWAKSHQVPHTVTDGAGNPVLGDDGQPVVELRPLMPGDKATDSHGNKGVINVVIDPDVDYAEQAFGMISSLQEERGEASAEVDKLSTSLGRMKLKATSLEAILSGDADKVTDMALRLSNRSRRLMDDFNVSARNIFGEGGAGEFDGMRLPEYILTPEAEDVFANQFGSLIGDEAQRQFKRMRRMLLDSSRLADEAEALVDPERRVGYVERELDRIHAAIGRTEMTLEQESSRVSEITRQIEMLGAGHEVNDLVFAQRIFAANPDLDVIVSPFSPTSRRNAGVGREAIDTGSVDLHTFDRDGNEVVVPGGIGKIRMMITDKLADNKTHFGNGRKAGFQFDSVLASVGAEQMLSSVVGDVHATADLVELAAAAYGDDIAGVRCAEHGDENVYAIDDHLVRTDAGHIDVRRSLAEFSNRLMAQSGYVELPFELKFPDIDMGVDDDGNSVKMDGYVTPAVQTEHGERYMLRVMDVSVRKGVEDTAVGFSAHEYSKYYERMFDYALGYLRAESDARIADEKAAKAESALQGATSQKEIDKASKMVESARNEAERHRARMSTCERNAQRQLNSLVTEVRARSFDGDSCVAKERVLGGQLPGDYGTAVWSANPHLPLDVVAVGPEYAKEVGVSTGDDMLVWRPPCLHESTARSLKVWVDPRIHGVAVHPEVAAVLKGDFDGDTVGTGIPRDMCERREMADKLDVAFEVVSERGAEPDLAFGGGTDSKLARHVRSDLAEAYDDIERRAVEIHEDYASGKIGVEEYRSGCREILGEVSRNMAEGYAASTGTYAISFTDAASYIQSVYDVNVATGVKGGMSAVDAVATNLGVVADKLVWNEVDGRMVLDPSSVVDTGHSLQTYTDYLSTMDAGALKSFATGRVGMFQQKALAALPGMEHIANALTEPLYQMPLDWKHVGAVARRQYAMIDVISGVLEGEVWEPGKDGIWRPKLVFDENGRRCHERYTDEESFVAAVHAVYAEVDKDNISNEYVREMAHELFNGSYIEGLTEHAHKVAAPIMLMAFTEGGRALVEARQKGEDIFMTRTGNPEFDEHVRSRYPDFDEVALLVGASRESLVASVAQRMESRAQEASAQVARESFGRGPAPVEPESIPRETRREAPEATAEGAKAPVAEPSEEPSSDTQQVSEHREDVPEGMVSAKDVSGDNLRPEVIEEAIREALRCGYEPEPPHSPIPVEEEVDDDFEIDIDEAKAASERGGLGEQ